MLELITRSADDHFPRHAFLHLRGGWIAAFGDNAQTQIAIRHNANHLLIESTSDHRHNPSIDDLHDFGGLLYRVVGQAAIRIFGHDLLDSHERLLDDSTRNMFSHANTTTLPKTGSLRPTAIVVPTTPSRWFFCKNCLKSQSANVHYVARL